MQLHLILDAVEPAPWLVPPVCPIPRCGSTQFRLHQQVSKSVGDVVYHHVTAHRYKCLRCGSTFRVYPRGVTHAYTSQRVQQVAVTLHVLGLSFGAVSMTLNVLGVYMCKSRVYDAVQAAKRMEPHWTRLALFEAVQRPTHGRTLFVKCMHHWLPLALTSDACSRLVLALDPLSTAEIATLCDQMRPLVAALGGGVELVDEHHSAGYTTS
jgi:transposase-like protein